jgi:hypothetical protein
MVRPKSRIPATDQQRKRLTSRCLTEFTAMSMILFFSSNSDKKGIPQNRPSGFALLSLFCGRATLYKAMGISGALHAAILLL